MTGLRALALLLALALPAAVRAAAPAQPSVQYSADFSLETEAGVSRGHLNVAPGKERREMVSAGMSMITIRRGDRGRVYLLIPGEKLYKDMKAGESPDSERSTDASDYETEITEVGPETLNGLATRKSKVVMKGKDGTKMGGFWWVTEQGIVVKMDVIGIEGNTRTRMKNELSNLVIGPQDAKLFEVPEDYTKMPSMGLGMSPLTQRVSEDEGGDPAEDEAGDEPAPAPEPKKKRFGLKDAWDLAH